VVVRGGGKPKKVGKAISLPTINIIDKQYCPYFNAYLLLKHTLKILGEFLGHVNDLANFTFKVMGISFSI
jgi:hypothetical protein